MQVIIGAHILRELNIQARNPVQIKKVEHRTCSHILQELICRHRSYTSQKLCTYPPGIKYVGTDPIQVKKCAHILQELNMQAHHTEFAHKSYKN